MTNDLGQRVSKTDSAGTSTYLFDGERVDAILADTRADYTRGGATGLVSERAGTISKTYHGDQLGSTRGITDATQATTDSRAYDAWGLPIASTGSTATPFGFAGGHGYQSDADSGLMLLGHRYYDPSVGRFITRDPIGYRGGLNLYAYTENDPVNATDPDGTSTKRPGPWGKIKDILEAWAKGRRRVPLPKGPAPTAPSISQPYYPREPGVSDPDLGEDTRPANSQDAKLVIAGIILVVAVIAFFPVTLTAAAGAAVLVTTAMVAGVIVTRKDSGSGDA